MILNILEEHLDEADFLFDQMRLSFQMLDVTGEDLARIDERLRAHLEGLLLGGGAAWALAQGFLAGKSVSNAYIAATIAMECGNPAFLDELERALDVASPQAALGIQWACCLTAWQGVTGFLKQLVDRGDPQAKAVAIEAMSYRGIDPGAALGEALDSPSEGLILAGLRGVGRLGAKRCLLAVRDYAVMGEPVFQAAALESLAAMDPENTRQRCVEILKADEACAEQAVRLLGVIAKKQDLGLIVQATASQNKQIARAATLALGVFGDSSAVPVLIGLLGHKELAGIAGVAIKHIVGDALPDDKEMLEPHSDDDDEDDWGPDDDLPRLSALAVGGWWEKTQGRFPAGVRYRRGEPYQPGQSTPLGTPLGLVKLIELGHTITASAKATVTPR